MKSAVSVDDIPVAGYVDSQIKKRDDLGLAFALGVVNLGAGLGAFTIASGADPIINGLIWCALGVGLSVYSIIMKNRSRSSRPASTGE
jgi:hypothetical protein